MLVMFSQSLISPPSVPPNGGGASHWAALEHSLPRPKSCVGAALTDGERLTDGRTLGPDEGCWDGCELGTDDGSWDGEDEGVPLGILLGAELLGSREGTLEGSKLGNAGSFRIVTGLVRLTSLGFHRSWLLTVVGIHCSCSELDPWTIST